jgi:hypothetical protein
MSNNGWSGHYLFDRQTLRMFITRISPGNYALGTLDVNGTFIIGYIGRSDVDLHAELMVKLSLLSPKYSHFIYCYMLSPRAAFEMECLLFHKLGESDRLLNKTHPSRPAGTEYRCPICE